MGLKYVLEKTKQKRTRKVQWEVPFFLFEDNQQYQARGLKLGKSSGGVNVLSH